MIPGELARPDDGDQQQRPDQRVDRARGDDDEQRHRPYAGRARWAWCCGPRRKADRYRDARSPSAVPIVAIFRVSQSGTPELIDVAPAWAEPYGPPEITGLFGAGVQNEEPDRLVRDQLEAIAQRSGWRRSANRPRSSQLPVRRSRRCQTLSSRDSSLTGITAPTCGRSRRGTRSQHHEGDDDQQDRRRRIELVAFEGRVQGRADPATANDADDRRFPEVDIETVEPERPMNAGHAPAAGQP